MTAGKGIVHSERTSSEQLRQTRTLHGIQTWLALPADHEDMDHEDMGPAFQHVPADRLVRFRQDAADLVLIAGTAYGHPAPFDTVIDLHDLEATIDPNGSQPGASGRSR